MSDSKEAQAARNEADRALRAAHQDEWETLMHDAFQKRGLTWNRRASKEERAERARLAAQEKARARISAEAEKAGIKVEFVDGESVLDLTGEPERVQEAIKATLDGTAETVEVHDWSGEDLSATQYDVNNPHDIKPF